MKMKLGLLFSLFSSLLFFKSSAQNYEWAHNVGLGYEDYARHAVTDASGNFYVVGGIKGTTPMDFNPDPIAVNSITPGSTAQPDGFVAKYSSTGAYQWAFKFGLGQVDEVNAVYTDGSFVYITGKFQGAFVDFDPGAGTVNLPYNAGTDVVIAKYNANDGSIVWAKAVGGPSGDEGLGITADASGNVYVTGSFIGTDVDFDPGAGTALRTSVGASDIYILKLNASGDFVYATTIGSTANDKATGIAVDGSSNAYITGQFFGTVDFNPDPIATNNLTELLSGDAFIAQYNSSGNFGWAFAIPGNGADQGNAIITDGSNIVVTGSYSSSISTDFDPGEGTQNSISNGGTSDIFIAKYATAGTYVAHKSIGGTGIDRGFALTKDATGDIYITGSFNNTVDFDPSASTNSQTATGEDAFVGRYDSNLNHEFAFKIGGATATTDQGLGIGVNSSGNVYVAGYFNQTVDFDPTSGTQELTSGGNLDIFFAKYCTPPSVSTPADQEYCAGDDVTFTVTASGPGTITYLWKKGAVTVSNGGRISGATTASLSIADVVAGDAGSYTVEIGNGCPPNITSSVIPLVVNTPPSISVHPVTPAAKCVGDAFDVSVTASGTGPLSYQWKRGTTNVGTNSSSLSIDPIATTDAGSYTVVVSGACAPTATSNAAVLTVNTPPSISVHPVPPAAKCVGDAFNVSVTATGTGPLSYQWKRGTTNVGTNSSSLSIDPIATTDAGSYTVVVSGACAPTATSNAAVLTVNTPPSISVHPVPPAAKCVGDAFNVSVTATGTGPLSYQWKRGTTNVGTNSSSLSIDPIATTDAGSYTVVVSGACAPTATSNAAVLTVNTPPSISVHPVTPAAKCVGDAFDVSVTATGTGPLSYQWKRGTTNVGTNSSSLSINPIATPDAGNYTVVVSGACTPTATSNAAVLTVNTPPSISVHPVTPAAKCVGDAFDVSVTATGTGPLSYQWKRGTTNVGTNSSSLSINPIATPDAGNYTVVVSGACTPTITSNAAVLTVNICTGVINTMENFIKVYPNPNAGKFTLDISQLEGKEIKLSITETNGFEVWNTTFANVQGALKEDIDLSGLEAGIYILRIENSDQVSIRRIVLTK